MHLMILTFKEDSSRLEIEKIIQDEESIEQIIWLIGDGKSKEMRIDRPLIAGSILSLFQYQQENIAFIIIKGSERVKNLANRIRSFNTINYNNMFSIPLTAV